MVTIVLIDPKSAEVIRQIMPTSHQVSPLVADMIESGGQDVQPLFAAPPGAKKLPSMIAPPSA